MAVSRCMPGMQTKLHAVFNNAGEYKGIASNYSGWGFSGMHFKAIATDQAGFDGWVETARSSGATLDRARYLELEAPSQNEKPTGFADVDPLLFARIVNMCVEQGKICMAEMHALDAAGGTGLAGTMNVTRLTYDKHGRRGTRDPVLGWAGLGAIRRHRLLHPPRGGTDVCRSADDAIGARRSGAAARAGDGAAAPLPPVAGKRPNAACPRCRATPRERWGERTSIRSSCRTPPCS